MEDREDLSKRLLRTKKETEELQNQLQKLIELGKNNFNLKTPEPSNCDTEKESSVNKVQIVKSYDPVYSKHVKTNISKEFLKSKPNSMKHTDKAESAKKSKHYDIDEAREYMKKQREKRLEQQKCPNDTKLKAEIRKKKLDELHKKSLELVARNVQLNRARSKSREREGYLRLDLHTRSRSVSRERNQIAQSISKKSENNPEHKERSRTVNRNPLANKVSTKKTSDLNTDKPQKEFGFENVKILTGKDSNIPNKVSSIKDICSSDVNKPVRLKGTEHSEKNSNINVGITSTQNSHSSGKIQSVEVSKNDKVNMLSNITLRSPSEPQEKVEISAPKLSTAVQETIKNPQAVENTNNRFPAWLQETPAQPYPFNFINTVKRKLQFVVQSPHKPTADVGIQSSVPENGKFEKPSHQTHIKSTPESIGALKLKSYTSHNYMNLDSGAIQHLELVPMKNSKSDSSNKVPTPVFTEFKDKSQISESESDTSKNIPEISSESRNSLRKNAESVRRNLNVELGLAISTEKLKNMKLVPHIRSSTTTIRTDNSPIKNSGHNNRKSSSSRREDKEIQYTSDFNSSTDDDILSSCLSRSRESVLSFNSPDPDYVKFSRSPVKKDVDNANNAGNTVTIRKHSSRSPSTVTSFQNQDYSEIIPSSKKISNTNSNIPSIKIINATLDSNFTNDIPHNFNVAVKKRASSSPREDSTPKSASSSHFSQSVSTVLSKSESQLQNGGRRVGSENNLQSDIPPLEDPKVSLVTFDNKSVSDLESEQKKTVLKNVTIRKGKNESNGNEVHLKFEAEIHLLDDFNKSLKKFSAAEKVYESLKNDNKLAASKILQDRDTQTSILHNSWKKTENAENVPEKDKPKRNSSSINFIRASVMNNSNDTFISSSLMSKEDSIVSNLNLSESTSVIDNESKMLKLENIEVNNMDGFSLNMFDQLIKDEDARLENLKTILKIREKILLDRTKAELAWLEIQRKQFKETGNLQEASIAKKKQRAILLNHEKEKHEMHRLKQMQRAASAERKIILKQQRNLILKKLSTDNMLKMRIKTPRERKATGPLKVVQSHTESVLSETSLSVKSSSDRDKEVYSILSHHSVSKISEIEMTMPSMNQISQQNVESLQIQEHIKKTLLMRESELKKRRKAAEQLLQWHKQLLKEEQGIKELEVKAKSVISQKLSTSDATEKYKFKGRQLNQLWYNLTGTEEKKFIEDKLYQMSQIALERFCRSAREYSTKTKKLLKGSTSDYSDSSVSEKILKTKHSSDKESRRPVSTNEYTSDFEVESLANEESAEVIENISELINNFDKIKTNILSLNITNSKVSDEDKDATAKTSSDLENSVIETNRTSKDEEDKSHYSVVQEIKSIDGEIKSSSDISEDVIEKFTNRVSVENDDLLIPEVSDLIKFDETDNISIDQSKINSQITTKTQENLNKSKEILILLGEPKENICVDVKISSDSDIGKENVDTSEDILLTLNQIDERSSANSHNSSSKQLDDNILTPTELHQEPKTETAARIIEENESLNTEEISDSKISETSVLGSPTSRISSLESMPDINSPHNLSPITKVNEEAKENVSKIESHLQNKMTASDVRKETEATSENKINTEKTEDRDNENYFSSTNTNGICKSESPQENDINVNNTEIEELFNKSAAEDNNVVKKVSNGLPEKQVIFEENSEHGTLSDISEGISEDKKVESSLSKLENGAVSPVENENIVTETSDVDNKQLEECSNILRSTIYQEDDSINNIDKICEDNSEGGYKITDIEEVLTSEDELEDNKNANGYDKINQVSDNEQYKFNSISEENNVTENNLINKVPVSENDKSSIISSSNNQTNKCIEDNSLVNSYTNSFASKSDNSKVVLTDHSKQDKSSSNGSVKSTTPESLRNGTVDVKKRVLEIMTDASPVSRGDNSPKLQDLYVTTYDLISPSNSPESGSPVDERKLMTATNYGNEAEEILKQQLAIEQEIKQITEQQQREQQIPFMYVREIPNKPPPPYTPPSSHVRYTNFVTINPTAEEIEEISKYSSTLLHKAYVSKNLDISISENTLSLISNSIPKERYKYVFDLCKDLAQQHYKQFVEEKVPSWLQVPKKPYLNIIKPFDVLALEKHFVSKLKENFGYDKPKKRENAITKWSRKKHDHVDEVLVMECQTEEAQWTNYEKDELLVMDQITNDIIDTLLKETGQIFNKILTNRS